MYNDGTKSYDHQHDGSSQIQGSCIRDFRNKPLPVRLKIEYINQELMVYQRITYISYIRIYRYMFPFNFRFTLTMVYHKMIMHLTSVHVLMEYNYLKVHISV